MTVRRSVVECALGLVLAVLLAAAPAGAQGGPGGGQGGGGGGTPGGPGGEEEAAANNLSYPAALTTGGTANLALVWIPPAGGGALGVNYSYGCDKPNGDYPNTSCIAADGTYLDAAGCAAFCGAGYAVARMYWQKVPNNDWWAETTSVALSQAATYVDWGDNLEAVSWRTTSVIRVETTPYATLAAPLIGLQMWHVSGQGPDEQWGVRATDSVTPEPWWYSSAYGSIFTSSARINLTKLGSAKAACPTAPGGAPTVTPTSWSFDPVGGGSWVGADLYEAADLPFTAELNVGGKYVHGYNWMLRRMTVPAGWSKEGWWRLTFYTADGAVQFSTATQVTPPPAFTPQPPPVTLAAEAEEEGSLYTPVVDAANNLSYIDICVVAKTTGKGGGSKGGGPKGR